MARAPKVIFRLALLAILMPVLLFASSGDLAWTTGWIFAVTTMAYTFLGRLDIARKHPDLISERIESMKKANVERWDRVLVPLIGILFPMATIIVAGLDRRFGWSPAIPLWVQLSSLGLMLLGALIAHRAVLANRFFSAVVRIQKERGHVVVTDGPYRFVRHPGYAGGLLFNFFMAPALGSLWALIAAAATIALTVIRTSLEDKTLHLKLEGYAGYAKRTRWRLIPGIW